MGKVTPIQFGAAGRVSKAELAYAKFDILAERQDRATEDLGRRIIEEKGWIIRDDLDGNAIVFEQNLYVFTPKELRDFIENKIAESKGEV